MAEPAPKHIPEPSAEDADQRPPGRSLTQAVVTALVLLAIIITCYLIGDVAFFVLAVVVVTIALFEMLDGVTQRGHKPVIPFGLLCGFGMMLLAFLEEPQMIAVVLAGTLFGAMVLALRPNRGPTPSTDVAWTVFGVAWVGGGGTGAAAILALGEGDQGVALLVAVVLTTAAGDIAAYFSGSALGRHKLAPSISPAKSWEGFVGGVIGALAAGLFFAALLDELAPVEGLALGAICGVFGPVGDLSESMFKREVGIKDSGRILPGHGGLLDRLDGIILSAPLSFIYLRFVVF